MVCVPSLTLTYDRLTIFAIGKDLYWHIPLKFCPIISAPKVLLSPSSASLHQVRGTISNYTTTKLTNYVVLNQYVNPVGLQSVGWKFYIVSRNSWNSCLLHGTNVSVLLCMASCGAHCGLFPLGRNKGVLVLITFITMLTFRLTRTRLWKKSPKYLMGRTLMWVVRQRPSLVRLSWNKLRSGIKQRPEISK
jgi:hypothetical protein